jgi:peptidoglycan/xylan/chitin deacetylase (PgdA/CDA1 family)
MSFQQSQARRRARERERRREARLRARGRRRRAGALAAVLVAAVIIAAVALGATGGSSGRPSSDSAKTPIKTANSGRPPRAGGAASRSSRHSTVTGKVTGRATGVPGMTPVPILMYHVINPPPAGAPFPLLYVPQPEFAAQMQALKAAGWHAVTLDQLQAYRTRGVPLGPGKPIVITFDNGYSSQYLNALPVLRRLGWVADENIQLTGLPPSQGGLSEAQVRGLIAAGWELDTQGISHADLITLDAAQLHYQVATAREILQRRYGVAVNWFCYPSGHYDAAVIAAVRAAGFAGSTTVIPGWAGPSSDLYRLPRLRVVGGTSPQALLAQIDGARDASAPPGSYGGAGSA